MPPAPSALERRLTAHVDRLADEHPPLRIEDVDFTVRDPAGFERRYGHVLGYMARVELEVDRNVLELTDAGQATLVPAVHASDEAEQQLLAELDDTEAAQLRTLLTRLARDRGER